MQGESRLASREAATLKKTSNDTSQSHTPHIAALDSLAIVALLDHRASNSSHSKALAADVVLNIAARPVVHQPNPYSPLPTSDYSLELHGTEEDNSR